MAMSSIGVGRAHGGPIELQVEDSGGPGRPVVLLHGWPVGAAGWQWLRPVLEGAGHRVIAYDRRGHGRSTGEAGGHDVDTAADDLQHLLEVLDVQDGALLGHGSGSSVALRYLGNCGGGRITRAVLVSPPSPQPERDGTAAVWRALRAALQADRGATLEAHLRAACTPVDAAAPAVTATLSPGLWQALLASVATTPTETLLAAGDMAQADLVDDLPRIDVPVLLVHGNDTPEPRAPAGVPALAAALDGARIVRLDGAPHGLIWTDVDRLRPLLLPFLAAA